MLARPKLRDKQVTRWKRRGRKRGNVNTNRYRLPYERPVFAFRGTLVDNFAASATPPSPAHNGVMIALRVPVDVAARIAQPGGEPPEELHVTLAYIRGPFAPALLGKIETVYEVWRRTTRRSVQVTLDKLATFPPSPNSDGKWVLHATVESDELLCVREQLVERLAANGVAVSGDFKFTPHVTLKYIDAQPADLPPFQRITFEAAESVMTKPQAVNNSTALPPDTLDHESGGLRKPKREGTTQASAATKQDGGGDTLPSDGQTVNNRSVRGGASGPVEFLTNAARSKPRPNPLRADPTRTSGVRRRWNADIKRRLAAIKTAIRKFLVTDDELGLVANAFCPTGEGGGIDPTCSPGGSSLTLAKIEALPDLEGAMDGSKVNPFYVSQEDMADSLDDASLKAIGEEKSIMSKVAAKRGVTIRVPMSRMSSIQESLSTTILYKYADAKARKEGALPIVVKIGGKFVIVDGNHRIVMAKLSGEAKVAVKVVDPKDVPRWNDATDNVAANAQRFRFASTPAKLAAFRKWLAQQMKLQGLLFLGEKAENQWWERYIREVWKQGRGQAYDAVNRSKRVKDAVRDYAKDHAEREPGGKYRTDAGGYKTEKPVEDFYRFGKESFLRDSFERPISAERVKVMAARTFTDLKGFSEDMATRLNRTLTDSLIKGLSPREMVNEIVDQVDVSESRALTIARTEVVRSLNEGALSAMEELGVDKIGVAIEWSVSGLGQTALGNKSPCPVCAPLEGIVMKIEEARGLLPRHPNCLVGDTPIRADGLLAATRSTYTGDIFTFRTSSGGVVSVTQNHILLTQHGFIPAYLVDEGMYLLDARRACAKLGHVNNRNDRVATVKEVFEAISLLGNEVVSTTPMGIDFHGDGQFMHGEVRVVRPYGKLRDKSDANLRRLRIEQQLPSVQLGEFNGRLSARSAVASFLKRVAFSFDSSMGRFRELLALLLGQALHVQRLGFAQCPRLDSDVFESLFDGAATAPALFRECLNRHPILKQLDDLGVGELKAVAWGESVDVLAGLDIDSQSPELPCYGVLRNAEFFGELTGGFSGQVPLHHAGVSLLPLASERLGHVGVVSRFEVGDPRATKPHGNSAAIHPNHVSNFLQSLARLVKLDQVVDVEVSHVRDLQVYDVQTESSLIIAGNVTQSQCMCSWIPANVGEDDEDQIDTQRGIELAIRESLEEEGGKESSWPGAEVEIDKERPESVFNALAKFSEVLNSFCPTGEGGGVDPTCSPPSSGAKRLRVGRVAQQLDSIAAEVLGQESLVDEVPELDPKDAKPILIGPAGKGRVELLDGFHRVAGMIKWARNQGLDFKDVDVPAIKVTDKRLAAAVADKEDQESHEQAVKLVHFLAGQVDNATTT